MPKRKLEEVEGDEDVGQEEGACGSDDSNSSLQTNSSTDVPTAQTTTTAGRSMYLFRIVPKKYVSKCIFLEKIRVPTETGKPGK